MNVIQCPRAGRLAAAIVVASTGLFSTEVASAARLCPDQVQEFGISSHQLISAAGSWSLMAAIDGVAKALQLERELLLSLKCLGSAGGRVEPGIQTRDEPHGVALRDA